MPAPEDCCPDCGARFSFDSKTQKLFCRFCTPLVKGESPEHYHEADCPEDGTAALSARVFGMPEPELIIPFKLKKEEAQQALRAYLHAKVLAPDAFRAQNHSADLKGIYLPCWLFAGSASAGIQYHAARQSHSSDAEYDYTKTDYYRVFRYGTAAFEYVSGAASLSIDAALMEALEPFDYREALAFRPAYLVGYSTAPCDLDAQQAKQRAVERIKKAFETLLARTAQSYSTITVQSSSVCVQQGVLRYALVPVWLLTTVYKGRHYYLALNGQTGKLAGALPLSWARFWAVLCGLGMSIFALGAILLKFLLQ
ncbi:MAG: hypothetical protein LBO67_06630 [Spirochaetaceae bacterium]|jgi:hypothetical protein|nr:hypothetical protein [Spirochaetaceae bacterium]